MPTHLNSSLGQVVRVPQLGGDVEPEVVAVLNGAVTQLNTQGATLLKCLLQQQGFQQRVNLLSCKGTFTRVNSIQIQTLSLIHRTLSYLHICFSSKL